MNNTAKHRGATTLLKKYGAFEEGGRTMDMGAGFQGLKRFISKEAALWYTPVDVEERIPGSGTILCNLILFEFPFFLNEKVRRE